MTTPRLLAAPFLAAALGVLGACTRAAPPPDAPRAPAPPAIAWPTPAGWRAETIPFPLGFAPALPYAGVEELRFAPRFFDARAEGYFSYCFAFVLDDAPAFDAERLAADLRVYFTGLTSAVAGEPPRPEANEATVIAEGDAGDARARFRGAVRTFDAFGDRRALDLALAGESFLCRGRRVTIASLSPQPATHAIWRELAAVRASLSCAG